MPNTQDSKSRPASGKRGGPAGVVVSVDAMGGDLGPEAVLAGLVRSAEHLPEVKFILHGPRAQLQPMLAGQTALSGRCEIRDASGIVSMEDKPSAVLRNGKDTSMWSCIESVRNGEASAAVSCGNTGALMAISMIRLRRLPGVKRPAIACLWPSRNKGGFNIMLDVGADIRADECDLLAYALMGASYARNGLGVAQPRIGLLNVGTEDHKGRAELKAANDLIAEKADAGGFSYVGFVEGGDIPSAELDVIVTDGFTGNVALKTGEGTARLIGELLREAFRATPFARIASLLALSSLKRLNRRIDPRRVNGGVFLGLNGIVVKSHGSADATGVDAAIRLAARLANGGFNDRLAARVASAGVAGQNAPEAEQASAGGDAQPARADNEKTADG